MLESIKKQWSQSSPIKRISLSAGILLLLGMLIVGTLWVLHEDYQVLFSDLSPQDASAMISELDRLKVPYRLEDDGATILVEHDAVYKTRLKLMGKGLNLQGSVGFEIFNNSEFGMTEFSQKVNYQRAMQGELARTIMGFDEIKSARVHLVLPESGLFKRQNAKPKASVSVVMKANAALSQEQIAGIQRLVAASVPEISPAEVTVMDQRGTAVSKQSAANSSEAELQDRLAIKKQLEDYMTRKIVSVVDKAVGPGKAIVSVDVALNYDQVKVVKEDVVPLPNTAGQEVGAITRRKESSQGNNYFGGTDSLRTKLGEGLSAGPTSVEVEFTNSRRVEQILSSQGNILRLNVGVLLPETPDRIKLAKLKEVVSMVAGINPDRGDGLAVYGIDMPEVSSSVSSPGQVPTPKPLENSHQESTPKPIAFLRKEQVFMLLAAIVLLAVILIYFKQQRNKAATKLTPDERNRLLSEISQWAKSPNL